MDTILFVFQTVFVRLLRHVYFAGIESRAKFWSWRRVFSFLSVTVTRHSRSRLYRPDTYCAVVGLLITTLYHVCSRVQKRAHENRGKENEKQTASRFLLPLFTFSTPPELAASNYVLYRPRVTTIDLCTHRL